MLFRSIRWRIAISYGLLILGAMLVLTLYVSDQVRSARLAELEDQLLADASLMADNVEALLLDQDCGEELDTRVQHWAESLGMRVTVMGANGVVLSESDEDPAQMDNHLYRPEVQQALAKGEGSSIRNSQTVGYEMMYAAVPVLDPDQEEVVGFMRVALPLQQVEASVSRLRQTVVTAGLATAALAVFLAIFIAERTVRPVRRLTRVANRLAEGDLNARLFPTTRDEVGQLTQAFNEMAEQLRDKVVVLAAERGRLAAVLEHMADGVLITDDNGRVQLINPAAAQLLNTDEETALGLSYAQVVRHHQLIELWRRCQERGEEQVEAMEISYERLFLQAIVTPFQQAEADGYLVILQDLTRIRRLETVRRDFISNISHELRTPLAGLKALVDTLRDGAMQDPPAAQRFLNRMENEVDVLTQMVQELLELSRIESGQVPLRLIPTSVPEILVPPIERLRPQAERAQLEINVELSPSLPLVLADLERIRQVATNLVHNAIKFTPAHGTITVLAESTEDEVIISVSDTGVGIPADDLSRIFERFYKADRARSGGGTGLGLSIAKHIVQGHGGRIWAKSVEGQGSVFYFALPVTQH
jgi:two-component system phosphate regulon sensor histidine kinase PhoR